MAQTPKGRLVQGLYKPIHGNCAMYFYLGVRMFVEPKKEASFQHPYFSGYVWVCRAGCVDGVSEKEPSQPTKPGKTFNNGEVVHRKTPRLVTI